jgi:Fe-S-cluster-containing hydrogenase component 2
MKKLFVDKRACLGCRFCEIICSLAHSGNKVKPSASRIKLQEDLAECKFKPVVCRACEHPECVEACDYDAIQPHPELGVPVIDPEKCTGCLACLEACPFNAMFQSDPDQPPLVCDLCAGDPKCVQYCPMHPTKAHAALNYISPEKWATVKAGPVERDLDQQKTG